MNFYELNEKIINEGNEIKENAADMHVSKQMSTKPMKTVTKRFRTKQDLEQFIQTHKDREFYAKAVERAQAADKDTDEDEHKRKTIKDGEQFASRKKGKHRGRPKGATVGGNPRYSGKKGLGSTNQPDNFRTKNQDLGESKTIMNFYELNKKMNEQSYQQVMGRPDEFLRMPAIINRIKKFGRPIGFRGPEKLSKEIEDELAKIGNIETHEEAMEKWRKIEKQYDDEKEYMRQKEEERWSQEKKAFKQDVADNKELDELDDWLVDHGHIPDDPDAWNMNNIEDVSAVYKTLGSLAGAPVLPHDRKMIEKLGQHLKQLKSQRALAKMF